jgi:hypothetical protein
MHNNEIGNMFTVAITTKSDHPGFVVSAIDRNGVSGEVGPYSRDVALEMATYHFEKFPTIDVQDLSTGELIYCKQDGKVWTNNN